MPDKLQNSKKFAKKGLKMPPKFQKHRGKIKKAQNKNDMSPQAYHEVRMPPKISNFILKIFSCVKNLFKMQIKIRFLQTRILTKKEKTANLDMETHIQISYKVKK